MIGAAVEPRARSNAPPRTGLSPGGRSKQSEAYRRKQGEGVVTYVKPLSRNNKAMRRLLRRA